MKYPSKFISLVSTIAAETDDNLKFIGQGNPNAQILLVGKDCNIDTSTTRGKGCYEMEYLHNTSQWEKNIANNIDVTDVTEWSIGEDKYNPLYPYKGLHNIKAERTETGEVKNGGASATWCAYQKLADKMFHYASPAIDIDFHQHTFMTVLCSNPILLDSYSKDVEKSVKARCESLFSTPFFRSFPVTIMACGRFAKDYHIDIEHVFNQSYKEIKQEGKDWIRLFEHEGRLLIHTRPIKMCSDVLLDIIAKKVQQHMETPLLKYCLYYDGSDESCENTQWGYYERHWLYKCVQTNNQAFQWDVKEMILNGISEEWIDSFDIPRTLVGIFYNRYCHWVGMYDKKDFMKWFEKIRRANKKRV